MPESHTAGAARLPEVEPRAARPTGILTRYLLRLHVGPFIFALSALTLLLLLNEIGQRFGKLLGKGLDWTVIAKVFALSLPFILAVTIPMAVLIAVLYTFNRLASENEITALKASGLHLPRLLAPLILAGMLTGGGLVWFNNTILPSSNHRLALLLSSIGRKKPTFVLRERTINEVLEHELYLQAARIDRARSSLEDVAIYDRRTRDRARTIYADSGRMAYSTDQTDLFLTLFDGTMFQRKESEPDDFERLDFVKLVMRVPGVSNQLQKEQESGYRGDREMSVGQMDEQVREARDSQDETRTESRTYAAEVTRRLLGFPMGEDSIAGADSARAAGADTARPAGSDTGRVRDEAARRDSALAAAAQRARRDASRANALVSIGTQFGSYRTRLRGQLQRASRYQVEIQKKFAIPVACLVFVLIGGPIAVRYKEGGIAMVVAVGLIVFCAYYVSLVAGEGLADRLIVSPYVAMWSPDVLFGLIGLGFMWREVKVG